MHYSSTFVEPMFKSMNPKLIFLLFQMAPISFKSTNFSNKPFSTSHITQARSSLYKPHPIMNPTRYNLYEVACVSSNFSYEYKACLKKRSTYTTKRDFSLMTFASKESGSSQGQDDPRALETVLRLYTTIKNRNINELSDIIGEECLCISNFVSRFQPFHGKEEVMKFFTSLIGNLGDNFEFVVQTTLHDGMTVGVSWRLKCSKTHVPLGKGFSLYMCHSYQGKVLIRNVEMFMEPLLHIEPFRLKMMGFVMNVMAQIASQTRRKVKRKKAAYIMCFLVFIVALLLWLP